MTERVFRKRFVLLWAGFTVTAIVVSRVLLISRIDLEWQRIIYQAFWLGTIVAAIVMYRKGSVTDGAERDQLLAKPSAGFGSVFGFFGSVFFLGILAVGLGWVIWDARYESWKFGMGMLLFAPINLWWMTIPFLQIRNRQLHRMTDKG